MNLFIPLGYSGCCSKECNTYNSVIRCLNAEGTWNYNRYAQCEEGCKGMFICCPADTDAYCSDRPDSTAHSYCDTPSSAVCVDTEGDRYRVNDCVTTSRSMCSSGWMRCTTSGYFVCDDTCESSNNDDDDQPRCNNVGLNNPLISQPVFSINSPPIIEQTEFIISCPVNGRYDCISAYSDQTTQCTWRGAIVQDGGWNGNNALFVCSGKNQGQYSATCRSVTGTSSNCCADSKSTTYDVIRRVKGYHDASTCTVSLGWACDSSSYSTSLTILVYDGPISNNVQLGTTTANIQAEQAVCNECGGTCSHRFQFSMPLSIRDRQQHQIYIYARDTSGTPRLLINSPKTIRCDPLPLQLSLQLNDTIVQRSDGIRATVTATSNSQPVSNILVNFYIRDSTNTLRYSGSCNVVNGQCYIDYQIPSNINPSEFDRFWSVQA
ncbi:MAG: hypothetical protein N3D75_04715, partial [Candidatus Aenigmarchaeota archaeon]|nr:hypothetical protein [Candidatus Aenigmarchaeota archaeon]